MRYGISSLVLVSALYLAAGESAKSASEWEEGKPMTTTIAETYDFFTVTRARKKIGLQSDTEIFTLGIGGTTVGYLAVEYLNVLMYEGFTDDATSTVEKLSNAKYLKKIDFDFSDAKVKRRENKYGYLKYMDRTGSRYRCIVYAQRLGAVLGSEYVFGRLCLNTGHRAVENLDQRLFEFIENLRTDGSGKQLTALRGEGSTKGSPSRTASATPATTSIKSEPNTYFDGPWHGTMMCGTCENCLGPLTREVQIDIQEGSFEIIMDGTYHGEGTVDKKNNMEFHYTTGVNWRLRFRPTFEFAGKLVGKIFQLEGIRGSRTCNLSLARQTS